MTKEDKQIAEKVMGWDIQPVTGFYRTNPSDSHYNRVVVKDFNPTTDANHDYRVLKHIRENWPPSERYEFVQMLQQIVSENKGRALHHLFVFLYYEPGDYSRAALKVLDE